MLKFPDDFQGSPVDRVDSDADDYKHKGGKDALFCYAHVSQDVKIQLFACKIHKKRGDTSPANHGERPVNDPLKDRIFVTADIAKQERFHYAEQKKLQPQTSKSVQRIPEIVPRGYLCIFHEIPPNCK